MKKNVFMGTLDRIEGDTAVILVGDEGDIVEIPRKLLPDGHKEGDIISFKLELKDKKTKIEKEKIASLIKKLSL